jgi:preprotein translocase subunit SecD
MLASNRFGMAREEPGSLSLPLTPDVSLDLADPPEFSALEDGRETVRLHFADEPARDLANLTEMYKDSGRRIAVVIGKEVISEHQIRSVIPDGRVQISCCDPAACERLKASLP